MVDKTKLLTAKDMIPHGVDSSIHLAIEDVTTYDEFRVAIRNAIQYLADHGALGKASAHVAATEQPGDNDELASGTWEQLPSAEDFPPNTFATPATKA